MSDLADDRSVGDRAHGPGSAWLHWLFVFLGLGMAAAAGVLVSRAWVTRDLRPAKIALGILAGAAVLAVSGVRSHLLQRQLARRYGPGELPSAAPGSVLPRLGEILVYKYHLVSEKDLRKALTRQVNSSQRLGEILVQMGKLDWRDLARALEDQLAYGDPWKR